MSDQETVNPVQDELKNEMTADALQAAEDTVESAVEQPVETESEADGTEEAPIIQQPRSIDEVIARIIVL